MKILYITPSFQHPLVRGPHRHYHFIRELSKRHQITLLTLTKTHIAEEAISEMKSYTEAIHTFDANGASDAGRRVGQLPGIGPRLRDALKLRHAVDKMKKVLAELMQKQAYDLVLFHGKSLFPVISDHNDMPIVVDFCDATSMRLRAKMRHVGWEKRPLLFLRYLKFRSIEKRLIRKTPHLAFVSHRDRNAVIASNGQSVVVPIGVDCDYWHRTTSDYQPNCIIFTGVMDYGPNHDAAVRLIKRILPALRQRVSDVEIIIAGRDPKPALQQLAKQNPEVTLTGFVKDMRPYLERAAVFVAPMLYGSGIQNKVLESMAMEVPVVTNRLVAEGLYIDSYGRPPVYLAESDDEFAGGLAHLLTHKEERNRMAKESRDFVKNHFTWSVSAQILESMCENAVQARLRFKEEAL